MQAFPEEDARESSICIEEALSPFPNFKTHCMKPLLSLLRKIAKREFLKQNLNHALIHSFEWRRTMHDA
jgi:hypothetical protein